MTRPALTVSLHLAGQRVLLVGADEAADDRAARLVAAGADLVRIDAAGWSAELARGATAVLAHTGDAHLDRRIAADARAAGALAYAHDQPGVSDFALPAVARRGPLTITVATDGRAPALARRLRAELARLLADAGPSLDALLAELQRRRAALPPGPERAEALRHLADRLRIDGSIVVDDG